MKKTILFLLVSVFALTSCKKDKNEPGENEPEKVEVKKTQVNVTLIEDDEVLANTKVYLFEGDKDPKGLSYTPFFAKNKATTDDKGKVQFNLDEYVNENKEESFSVAVFNNDILIKSTLFSIKKNQTVATEISYSIPNPLLGKWKLVMQNDKVLDKCEKLSYIEFKKKEYNKVDGSFKGMTTECHTRNVSERYKIKEDQIKGTNSEFTFSLSGNKLILTYSSTITGDQNAKAKGEYEKE